MTLKHSDRMVLGSQSAEYQSGAGLSIHSLLQHFFINYSGSVTPGEWAIVFGESPLSLPDAVSTHLEYIKAFGKCAQADTPTSTVPVDIVCNNGAIKAFTGNKWTNVGATIGYIIQTSSKEIQANSNYTVSAPIFLKAGDYNVSYYTPSTGARPFTILESNAQGDLIGNTSIFYIARPDVGTNTGTFTIDRDMYVRISWRNDFTNIVVAPTSAIIYYDGTLETVTIKQPFVNDSDVVDGVGLNSGNGVRVPNSNRCYVLFPCKAGVTYTAQTDTNDLIGGNFIEYNQPDTTSANFVKSLTVTNDGLVDGVYKSHVVCDTDGWAGWQCKSDKATAMANNWQITTDLSSATCQPLLSVGDYKDVQNITNGAITRNVGVKVLTGNEDWIKQDTRFVNSDASTDRLASVSGGFCNRFEVKELNLSETNTCIMWATNSIHIVSTQSTVADFKSWLSDNPVIIVYAKNLPTTETVTGQALTITKGDNIISAQGSLTGLELEAKYKKAS